MRATKIKLRSPLIIILLGLDNLNFSFDNNATIRQRILISKILNYSLLKFKTVKT